jgi:hypothetical protein
MLEKIKLKKRCLMKIMISVLGVLIVLAGVIPFLSNFGVLPEFIPVENPGYSFIIITIGILGLIYGAFNSLLFGFEKFATIAIAALTLFGGILPFIQSFLPEIIPTSGPLYSGIIILIGIIGLIYGFVALG